MSLSFLFVHLRVVERTESRGSTLDGIKIYNTIDIATLATCLVNSQSNLFTNPVRAAGLHKTLSFFLRDDFILSKEVDERRIQIAKAKEAAEEAAKEADAKAVVDAAAAAEEASKEK